MSIVSENTELEGGPSDAPERNGVKDEPGEPALSSEPKPEPDDSRQLSLAGIAKTHSDDYAGFDPSIHATNDDGTPKLKADGTYAKKRGRKAGASAPSALPPKNAGQKGAASSGATNSPLNDEAEKIDAVSRMSANMVINAAVWTMGEEVGKPTSKNESDGLLFAFRNYYEVRGVPNIPPELGLLVAIGAYIGPRLRHEKMRPKVAIIAEKVKSWIAKALHR